MQKCLILVQLTAVFAAALFAAACSESDPMQDILNFTYEPPAFIDAAAPKEDEIEFRFNVAVKLKSLTFVNPTLQEVFSGSSPLAADADDAEGEWGPWIADVTEGETITVRFTQALPEGQGMTVFLEAEDPMTRTMLRKVDLFIPFITRNDRMPSIRINEVRLKPSRPKAEFIELKTASAGNLGGMRLYTAANGVDKPLFTFPAMEVAANEYIVVHLRSYENETLCVNETASKASSRATDSSDSAWDFWLPQSTLHIRETDAVYLLDQDNRVLEGIAFENANTPLSSKNAVPFQNAKNLLLRQNAWFGAVFSSIGNTTTRTLCRWESEEDTGSASDWYLCPTSRASPGFANR